MSNEMERRANALADLFGVPVDVREDLKRMADIQPRMTLNLRSNKAISTKDLEEYNALCYKHFEHLQDGSEFEKEKPKEGPKEGPKECPKPADTTDFAGAIRSIKQGCRCARKGWNGKGQFIELACNISYMTKGGEIVNAHHSAIGNNAIAFVGTSGVQIGWLASQADMLADDWYMV